jgi:hypothetical protein
LHAGFFMGFWKKEMSNKIPADPMLSFLFSKTP